MPPFECITIVCIGGYIAYNVYNYFSSEKDNSQELIPENFSKKQTTILEVAIKAGERGMELEKQKRYAEALDCYDVAIKGGIKCYVFRAGCLASLEWHLDAIDDYDKAIAEDPSDCNLYFLRSQSKHAVGDKTGIDDLKRAIDLSKNNSSASRENNENAKLMGLQSATFLYESSLSLYPEDNDIRNMIFRKLADAAKIKGRRIKN
jgi:tetratricopeptide (TPR) repeat protein